MTARQRILIRQSEVRERLREIAGLEGEDLTDEIKGEAGALATELQDLEVRYRAAEAAEDADTRSRTSEPSGEERELERLTGRASVGRIFAAVAERRSTEGAEAELQKHFSLRSNEIPLELLMERPGGLEREARAVTPAPANVGRNEQTVIPAVFPRSQSAFMGVEQVTVDSGEAVFPVLTNQDAAADFDESANAPETTGAFSADVLQPRRVQASFFYSREDRARFPQLDSSLRMNLSDALAAGVDKYTLAKAGLGLFDFGADPAVTQGASAADAVTFEGYRGAAFGMLDGRYASEINQVRCLVGAETYQHMATVYRTDTSDLSVLMDLAVTTGGIRISGHAPAAIRNVADAVMVRGPEYRHAVCPMWRGIEIIYDDVTKAATGEIVLTAVLLMAFQIVRPAGFKRFRFRLGA